jgi:DNA-binding NarL/FixJ family response regulator
MNMFQEKINNPTGVTGYIQIDIVSVIGDQAVIRLATGEEKLIDLAHIHIRDHDLLNIPVSHDVLTPRQEEIADVMMTGMRVKEHAYRTKTSISTMKIHYAEIRRKYRCDNHTRTALIHRLQREYQENPPRFQRFR